MEQSSFTGAELAARARVGPELVDRLVELGILAPAEGQAPYGLGDVRRVRLADACRRAGLSLEGIGEAIAAGRLSFAFLDLVSLADLVEQVSLPHGGQPVKWLGDGVMFHFRRPGQAVVAALEMVERTPLAGLPPAHVGLHAGPVVFQDGDYFGRTVNLAARIAGHAGPGQVLVSDQVVAECPDGEVAFEPIGPVPLKGVADPVPLHRASRPVP